MQFFTRTRQRDENCGELTTPLVGVLADGDLVTVVLHREYDQPVEPAEVHEHVVLSLARRRRQARRALGARDDRRAVAQTLANANSTDRVETAVARADYFLFNSSPPHWTST